MTKPIRYARVSTKAQDTDRQIQDLLAAGIRQGDRYIDHGQSGALAKRPGLDKALNESECRRGEQTQVRLCFGRTLLLR
ncbi:recombinase family protein [Glutamicibacter creatinolyticus]|uniref:recombinase family protein n=1 Tax=Glutamicibacter creatinolyticus TaxID=162496 RepID=UPI0031E3A60E